MCAEFDKPHGPHDIGWKCNPAELSTKTDAEFDYERGEGLEIGRASLETDKKWLRERPLITVHTDDG